MENSNETLITSSPSKDYVVMLRTKLLNNIPRLWTYVYNINNECWKLTIANEFNGKVKDSVKEKALQLVKTTD